LHNNYKKIRTMMI